MKDTTMSAQDQAILAKLDELIAVTRAGTIPMRDRWGDAAAVGAMLGQAPRYVREKLACLPDFPKPLSESMQPRWLLAEVQEWALEYRRRNAGSRRKFSG